MTGGMFRRYVSALCRARRDLVMDIFHSQPSKKPLAVATVATELTLRSRAEDLIGPTESICTQEAYNMLNYWVQRGALERIVKCRRCGEGAQRKTRVVRWRVV